MHFSTNTIELQCSGFWRAQDTATAAYAYVYVVYRLHNALHCLRVRSTPAHKTKQSKTLICRGYCKIGKAQITALKYTVVHSVHYHLVLCVVRCAAYVKTGTAMYNKKYYSVLLSQQNNNNCCCVALLVCLFVGFVF